MPVAAIVQPQWYRGLILSILFIIVFPTLREVSGCIASYMFTNLGLVMSLCVILIETVVSLYTHMCVLFPLKITAASADKSGFTSAAGLFDNIKT